MSGTQQITEDRRDRVIEDSIREQRATALTLRTERGWQVYRSRFLSGSRPSQTLVLRVDAHERSKGFCLPAPGETLGVSFRSGHMKCMFSTTLESARTDEGGSSLAVRWPDHVQRLQRRVYERSQPPPGSVVPVRFWRHEHGFSTEAPVRYGQLEDVSAGGIRIQTADSTGAEQGASYRCAFSPKPHAPSLVVDAALRHVQAIVEQGRISLGFQFVGLETSAEGRRVLDRLAKVVTYYHRTHDRPPRRPPAAQPNLPREAS